MIFIFSSSYAKVFVLTPNTQSFTSFFTIAFPPPFIPLPFSWHLSQFPTHMLRRHKYLMYGIDYTRTFSTIVRLTSIRVFFSLVFMEQPPRYVLREGHLKYVISYFNVEARYHAMTKTTCEMIWLCSLLKSLDIFTKSLTRMSYDAICTNLCMFDLYTLT
ncbi:unnamed protein product [Spirodela intermedia]|uniref:Uncharacterized protein n=1 Tax=Spirodela intermedia TaxID=51605 RepID=A0A7I8JAJ2_SPIIN|nr:unnamed protein product [Spirodela intermedia]CAA6667011.1 unnamed protein product [Spirodela intermedia]